MTIGQRVAHEREAAGWHQAQLARAIGTDQPTISKIEKGALQLSAKRAAAICDALGITMDRLMGRMPSAAAAK